MARSGPLNCFQLVARPVKISLSSARVRPSTGFPPLTKTAHHVEADHLGTADSRLLLARQLASDAAERGASLHGRLEACVRAGTADGAERHARPGPEQGGDLRHDVRSDGAGAFVGERAGVGSLRFVRHEQPHRRRQNRGAAKDLADVSAPRAKRMVHAAGS